MNNFEFYNPVKIIFGEGEIAALSKEIPKQCRILMTYGGGSIKKNGVYDQVKLALKNHTVFEFDGIEPNPHYETLMKAVELVKKEKIDFLLAVGGGSVIDGTKFIAAAACYENGDPWDILAKQVPLKKALSFATVLTLPAAGSEMNSGAVITRAAIKAKLAFMDSHLFPKFSILDPSTTYTLPPRQTSNGVIDTFVHVVEQYVTYSVNAPLQDRISESILLTLIEEAPKALKDPNNYEVRANIMWCATMALNGVIKVGVPEDWSMHLIAHELTAKFGLDHGQTLAIILPGVWKIKREAKREKLLQYAKHVWNISQGSEEERIHQAIEKTRNFFESLGVKTRLHDYQIAKEAIPLLLEQLKQHGMTALGEHGDMDLAISEKILIECL